MDHETQASRVAELHENASKTLGKSILFLSGKGGTGKSNAALNIALALSKMDRRVTLLDTNLQVTDISMLMGFEQRMNFREALYEGKAFHDLLVRDKSGLGVICGGIGFDGVEGIEDAVNDKLTETLYQCRLKEDFLLIDTPPGICKGSVEFARLVDEIVIMLTPEPATVSDSYALIKILKGLYPDALYRILVNFVESREEAEDVFERFELVVNHFLESSVDYLGFIPEDARLRQAVCERVPLYAAFPESESAGAIGKIAWRISA